MAQPLWKDLLTDGYLHYHEDRANSMHTSVVGEILNLNQTDENRFYHWMDAKGHNVLIEYSTDFALAVENDHHDIAWDRHDAIRQYLTPERIENFNQFRGS